MKKSTILLLFAALIITGLGSCKKDNKSKFELLTDKSWRIISSELSENGGPFIDSYPAADDCEKDNFIVFKANNDYESNEGNTKCDPSDPQIEVGYWDLQNNETEFMMDGQVSVIEKLDKNTFIFSGTFDLFGDTYDFKITMGH